jgi:hypothetical protein
MLLHASEGYNIASCCSQDLLTVCRELNLEDSLEELMRELGADEQGRISYQEFLRRRLALRPEIDALRGGESAVTQVHCRGTPEYLPTSSDNSLGKIHVFSHARLNAEPGLVCLVASSLRLSALHVVCSSLFVSVVCLFVAYLTTPSIAGMISVHLQ